MNNKLKIFDFCPLGVFIIGSDGRCRDVNPAACDMLGYTREELLLLGVMDLLHDFCNKAVLSEFYTLQKTGELHVRADLINKYRTLLPVSLNITHLPDSEYMVFCSDITESRQTDAKTKILIDKNELILKEMHHRMKNNINTMINIIALQAGTVKNYMAAAVLKNAESRLRSVEKLYEKIYSVKNLRDISVRDFLPTLIEDIVSIYPDRADVKIEKHIDDFILKTKLFQPIVIIINELLTNTMKYAFRDASGGKISISLTLTGNTVSLLFNDNGEGIPESIDFKNSTGFGLKLVGMLAEQIDARARIGRNDGTEFVMELAV